MQAPGQPADDQGIAAEQHFTVIEIARAGGERQDGSTGV